MPQRRWSWLTQSLVEAGYEVAVVAPGGDGKRFQKLYEAEVGTVGEDVIRVSGGAEAASITVRALKQAKVAVKSTLAAVVATRKGSLMRPDLVIGTVPAIPTVATTILIARLLKVPYAVDIRDAWPDLLQYSESWNKSTGKKSVREILLRGAPLRFASEFTKWLMNKVFAEARFLISTSSKFATVLKRRYPLGPRVVVVRNLFPTRATKVSARAEGPTATGLRVLYAGKVGRAQGLENAIYAVAQAEKLGVPVELRIVGSGAAFESLRHLAHRLGANVHFYDQVGVDSLDNHYAWASTTLVHLADWLPLEMTVPSKTYELMAIGMHITSVTKGETSKLVEDLGAGIAVPPDDPVALAEKWRCLWETPELLDVSARPAQWVQVQAKASTQRLLAEIATLES